jgi:UDP-N-acetylglucosamine 2-epimerase
MLVHHIHRRMQLMNAAQAIAEQQQRLVLQHQLIAWTRSFEERLRAIEQGFGDLADYRDLHYHQQLQQQSYIVLQSHEEGKRLQSVFKEAVLPPVASLYK